MSQRRAGFPQGTEQFAYKNGVLNVEEVAVPDIAAAVGTPFYVYSAKTIRQNFQNMQQAFQSQKTLIAYAVKASSNQAILKLLAKEGAGADIVSGGELHRALQAGIPAQKIVYSGVGKTDEEMDFALKSNIFCFNVESFAELYQLNHRAEHLNLIAPISIRINPDIDAGSHAKITTGKAENKFGISYQDADRAYQIAASLDHLTIRGVDVHIGSQIETLAPFEKAFAFAAKLVKDLRAQGFPIQHLDIGGGLGIAYKAHQPAPISVDAYSALVEKYFKGLELEFIAEPGRSIVGQAGALIGRVLSVKEAKTKRFIITDTGMNDLIRPTLYDAWHEIVPVHESGRSGSVQNKNVQESATNAPALTQHISDIVGPVCETGDYLALNRPFPNVQANDLLAVLSCGAYGASMADSYNSRRLVAEVLVDGDKFVPIRERQTYQELIAADKIPNWL